jgi:hypothetical protein
MNIVAFGAFLLLGGLAVLARPAYAQSVPANTQSGPAQSGPANAQSESVPPNAIESQSASDRPRIENTRPDSTVSLSFGPSVLSSGEQVEIPLAQRGDNSANNPPVDKPTVK